MCVLLKEQREDIFLVNFFFSFFGPCFIQFLTLHTSCLQESMMLGLSLIALVYNYVYNNIYIRMYNLVCWTELECDITHRIRDNLSYKRDTSFFVVLLLFCASFRS